MVGARKRAAGGGRKPQGPNKGMGPNLTIRLTPETRARLEKEATRRRWSLNQVIENRLKAALRFDETLEGTFGPAHTRAAAVCFARIIKGAEGNSGRRWLDDPFTFRVAQAGILQFLAQLEADRVPAGKAEAPESVVTSAARLPERFRAQMTDPEGIALAIVGGLYSQILTTPEPPDRIPENERYANEFNLLPRVREDLGLKRQDGGKS